MEVFQRFRPRRMRIQIPDGLKDLMSDISREVLRRQPKNIYSFVADYLDSLLTLRTITRTAERTLIDIHTMSKNIYDKFTGSGFQIESEHQTIALLRKHLVKFCFALLNDALPEVRQEIIDELVIKLTYLFDDERIDTASLRMILEMAFQVFARGMQERNKTNAETVIAGESYTYCNKEKLKTFSSRGSEKYDEADMIFIKNFREHMETCMK